MNRVIAYVWAVAVLVFAHLAPATAQPVQLTEDISFFDLQIDGKTIRIQRNQDNAARLTDDFSKTSRPCPPFCIHPISAAPGVDTYGEIEVLRFLNEKVQTGEALLVDARITEWHDKGTIPGSVNLPFHLLSAEDNPYFARILTALGAREAGGAWDFTEAKALVLFCNGPWCDQSPRAIKSLISAGYPTQKLKYYRGGMQAWKLLGLTIVTPQG